ncbi:Pentatricopeptide repeat-containing protein, putative isoform 1 [Hibiscus syriacus]|uniref:Pentatricopeptide repeat-containing protein, putative isoform 1 n=1 Tax=Hibiscus syriacus TaxID=106335 RepID=A0A6A2YSI1_HIBSY|nr:Pentatricopeptide repeat-containing protein, putative isoform 1 [Hibiscus syriacus]
MIAASQQKQAVAATAGATKASAEEEALKRNTDCVYFLASPLTCKKGIECEYRHSEYARVNPRDCYYWMNGNCMNQKCGFRHPPLDGLLGNQVPAPASSSVPSSHITATPTPASYNQGDLCAFLHGPSTSNKSLLPTALNGPSKSNKAPQPTNFTATEPNSSKKTFGAAESSQLLKFPQTNVSKTVGVPPEELPQYKGTYTTSIVNGSVMGRSNCLHQPHVSDEPSFHDCKEIDEFLRECSPGFDVLVDDEHGDSDFYHGEDRYGGARGPEGRIVNEYDIGHAANYDAVVDVDREMSHDERGYDSFDHVQGNYGWDQRRASSERISLGPSTFERRGYSRPHSPDLVEESDLRHRLSKHKRLNSLRSVVSQDHALENHEGERNYHGSLRDSYHLPPHESYLSSRLQARIKLPGRSTVNGIDSHSEREIERGRNWGRLSPRKPTTSHQGRLCDRIRGRVEGEYNNKDGRRFGGSRIRREIMDERSADFAGPKSLAELKVCKKTDNKDRLSLGKRKSIIEDSQQTKGGISFEGPKPLSEILKRKRKSDPAAAGSGMAAVHKEDVNRKQSKETLNGSSTNTVVSLAPEEANRKEESKPTYADIRTVEVAGGESSQPKIRENETKDGIIGDVTTENDEHEADDQGDGDYYYEQGNEGENNYGEEEYMEDDGDDFEKKLGVMFS